MTQNIAGWLKLKEEYFLAHVSERRSSNNAVTLPPPFGPASLVLTLVSDTLASQKKQRPSISRPIRIRRRVCPFPRIPPDPEEDLDGRIPEPTPRATRTGVSAWSDLEQMSEVNST